MSTWFEGIIRQFGFRACASVEMRDRTERSAVMEGEKWKRENFNEVVLVHMLLPPTCGPPSIVGPARGGNGIT